MFPNHRRFRKLR